MDKKQQQNLALLFITSFFSLTSSRLVPDSGSNLMDFTQGLLTGIGITGMLMAIVFFGKYYKRSH
ncbi:hypothetical protein [Paenibacillus tianjinensis]|uniref:Uncharacterized protein n=1 Tax=Paenibacillus tianjinensis TaxID=2810347 RepID=A0ABX7LBS3_9BACL|nr:hypothetical protein [Paenibacillus tianjinensis]QSF45472.1 hypothetical protein JRJ22_02050 [Paenibacillus tianjinensis]